MTRDHSIETAVVDARALLMAAEGRLEDSNFHRLAQIIATAEAELVSTSGVAVGREVPEMLEVVQRFSDLEYTLAKAGFTVLREVAAHLREHNEFLCRALSVDRLRSPNGEATTQSAQPPDGDSFGPLRPAALWCEPERLGTAARLLAELGDCGMRVKSDDGLGPDQGGRVVLTGAIAKLTPNLLERLREYEKEVDALCALSGSGVVSRRLPRTSSIASELGDGIPF